MTNKNETKAQTAVEVIADNLSIIHTNQQSSDFGWPDLVGVCRGEYGEDSVVGWGETLDEAYLQLKNTVIMTVKEKTGEYFQGEIKYENGDEIGQHSSSTLKWLEDDLLRKLDDSSKYRVLKRF